MLMVLVGLVVVMFDNVVLLIVFLKYDELWLFVELNV